MNILIISDFAPDPPVGGDRLRLSALLGWLTDSGHEVSFLAIQTGLVQREELRLLQTKCRNVYCLDVRPPGQRIRQAAGSWVRKQLFGFQLGRNFLRARDRKNKSEKSHLVPRPVDVIWTSRALEQASQLIEQIQTPQVVIGEYITLSRLFELPKFSGALKILDAFEVMSERIQMLEKNLDPWIACSREEEPVFLRRADVIMANCPKDAETFRELAPGRKVISVGQPFEFKSLPEIDIADTCLFVGTAHQVNLEGLHWFQQYVWPLVLAEVPSAQFLIAGKAGEFAIPHASVQILGEIPEIDAAYQRAAVVIVPTFSGGSLKMKLLEAFSRGKAVIATAHAALGIENQDVFLSSNDPKQFAAFVIELLKDKNRRRNLEEKAGDYVRENLSRDRVYRALKLCLDQFQIRQGAKRGSFSEDAVPDLVHAFAAQKE